MVWMFLRHRRKSKRTESNSFLNRKRCSSDAGDVSHVLIDMMNAPDQEDSAAADILFAMRWI